MTAATLPSGDVTLLFTDVEGSTRLWELHGDRMLPVLADHDRIVAAAVAGADGVLQLERAEGDSSFAVFADPGAAVRAAIALQRGMSEHPWPSDLQIRTRAALHTGAVEVRGNTYYGAVVNRCVRLRSLAHGAQTILSRATFDAVVAAGGWPPDTTAIDLGTHRLKDLAVPERVYELRHPDLAVGFPPLRSPDVEQHNLPEVLGRFVGRAEEQRAVTKALAVERLVTLVGTGGVGKTRLALEVAWERVRSAERHDGTWFVNLTGARSDDDVVGMFASALGVREQPGRPLIETIADQIGERAALIVVDNCEHVVGAVAGAVPVLLATCANARVLTTSREPLGLAGERRRAVPGLPLLDAVALFAERSGLASSDAVEQLCDRLDGIPLAIEIAAARAKTLGPTAVEEGVAQAQLEEAGRSVLEATLTWSYNLLEADEQTLFRRLGVFAGQFTLTGAESVVADEDLDVFDVLDLLDALLQRSLVLRTDDGGYRQLFVVREYAARLAAAAGEFDALAARHLQWCLALALSLKVPHLDERARFDPLRQIADDLLAALDRPFGDELAALQVQLGSALDEFWFLRGAFTEDRARLEALLARGAGFRSHRAELHRSAGHLARAHGDLAVARQHLTQARALFDEILGELRRDDSPHVAHFELLLAENLMLLSEVALLQGDAATAAQLASDAFPLSPSTGARALLHLGLAQDAQGESADADRNIAAALQMAQDAGDDALVAACERNLGVIARERGDLAGAEQHYRRAIVLDRRSASEHFLARTLLSLAELLALGGGDATEPLEEGLALARALSDRQAVAHGVSTLAELTAADDTAGALALLREALALRSAVGAPAEIALSQLRVAAFLEFEGDGADAAALTRLAADTFRRLADPRRTVEATTQLARICARMDDITAASAALAEALDLSTRTSTVLEAADLLDAQAWVEAAHGRMVEARALLAQADEHRRQVGIRPPEPTARLRHEIAQEPGVAGPV
jgi:predicted ATPase/class 3 adenylate cyclase